MTSQDVILGLLMKRSLSGYEIKHVLQTLLSYFYDASFGTIYPTLGKLERDGMISKVNVHQEGKPNKHVYTITDAGKRSFLDYLEGDLQPDLLRSDFMVRLFYGELAEPELVERWFTARIRKTEEHLQRLQGDYAKFEGKFSLTQEVCIRCGLAQVEAHLQVLREGLEKLKSQGLE